MNWKHWGLVALLGVFTTGQGIDFKDAPTVQQVLLDFGNSQPGFKQARFNSTDYKDNYSWSAGNTIGVLSDITMTYSNTNETYYKIPKIPANLNEKQGQEYFRKHILPPKDLGKYAHSMMVGVTLQDGNQNTALTLFRQLSTVVLRRCYGFTPASLQKVNSWMQTQNQDATLTVGAINLKLMHSSESDPVEI